MRLGLLGACVMFPSREPQHGNHRADALQGARSRSLRRVDDLVIPEHNARQARRSQRRVSAISYLTAPVTVQEKQEEAPSHEETAEESYMRFRQAMLEGSMLVKADPNYRWVASHDGPISFSQKELQTHRIGFYKPSRRQRIAAPARNMMLTTAWGPQLGAAKTFGAVMTNEDFEELSETLETIIQLLPSKFDRESRTNVEHEALLTALGSLKQILNSFNVTSSSPIFRIPVNLLKSWSRWPTHEDVRLYLDTFSGQLDQQTLSSTLFISHKWVGSAPDTRDNLCFQETLEIVTRTVKYEYVWFDYTCVPQSAGKSFERHQQLSKAGELVNYCDVFYHRPLRDESLTSAWCLLEATRDDGMCANVAYELTVERPHLLEDIRITHIADLKASLPSFVRLASQDLLDLTAEFAAGKSSRSIEDEFIESLGSLRLSLLVFWLILTPFRVKGMKAAGMLPDQYLVEDYLSDKATHFKGIRASFQEMQNMYLVVARGQMEQFYSKRDRN